MGAKYKEISSNSEIESNKQKLTKYDIFNGFLCWFFLVEYINITNTVCLWYAGFHPLVAIFFGHVLSSGTRFLIMTIYFFLTSPILFLPKNVIKDVLLFEYLGEICVLMPIACVHTILLLFVYFEEDSNPLKIKMNPLDLINLVSPDIGMSIMGLFMYVPISYSIVACGCRLSAAFQSVT